MNQREKLSRSKAWLAGYKAFSAKEYAEGNDPRCPHEQGTPEGDEWVKGYAEAEQEYINPVEPAPEISEEEDRAGFHEAAFLAALTGLCANPVITGIHRDAVYTVETARKAADAALDAYPFITDDNQLKKGTTQ